MTYDQLAERVLAIVSERAYRYRRCLRERGELDLDDIVSEAMLAFCEWNQPPVVFAEPTDAQILDCALAVLSVAQDRIQASHKGTRHSRSRNNWPRPIHWLDDSETPRARVERDAIGHDEIHSALSALSGYPVEVVEVLASDLNHTEAGEVIGVSKTTVRRHRSTLATLIICESATMSGSLLSASKG